MFLLLSPSCYLKLILVPRGRDRFGQRPKQKDRGLWGRECLKLSHVWMCYVLESHISPFLRTWQSLFCHSAFVRSLFLPPVPENSILGGTLDWKRNPRDTLALDPASKTSSPYLSSFFTLCVYLRLAHSPSSPTSYESSFHSLLKSARLNFTIPAKLFHCDVLTWKWIHN